ncbi:Non-specific lipid-transfer protein [Nymphaea thermarum]|nr:Non-specific lipid-transfer protein [Nymphaea thermarum]
MSGVMKMVVLWMVALVVAELLLVSPSYEQNAAAVECESIRKMLEHCLPYVTGIADHPKPACCEGVDHVRSMIHTHDERVEVCDCLKEKISSFRHINLTTLTSLPDECGFKFHFPLSPNVDCSQIP